MREVSDCVICNGPIRKLKRALVAPFLAKRLWNKLPFSVDLVVCESCGFIFYNPRIEDAELALQYNDFRSTGYFEMRNSFEPWYTEKFNDDLGSANSYDFRSKLLTPILREHLNRRKISRVLDYGGDNGGLVVRMFKEAELFLYDISGAAALPGVTSISDPAACRADLIVNSNVLEHVGFPRTLVGQIVQAAPSGGLIFVEVPCEVAVGFRRISRRLAQIGIMVARTPTLATSLLRREALYMMHEHINYFTLDCLTKLMQFCGASVISSGNYFYSSRVGSADMAWCLAEKQ